MREITEVHATGNTRGPNLDERTDLKRIEAPSRLAVQALFRLEAVEAAAGRSGDVVGIRPTSWSLITAFLFASLIALLAAALITKVSRKEQAVGWLVPSGDTVQPRAPRSGVISNLDVVDGQEVRLGQPLFTINSQELIRDGHVNVSEALLKTLRDQIDNLETQQTIERFEQAQVAGHYKVTVAALNRTVEKLQQQRLILQDRLRIGQNRIDALSALRASGLVSATEFASREDAVLSLRQDLVGLEALIERKVEDGKDAYYEFTQGQASFTARMAKLASEKAVLQARIIEVREQAAVTVAATISGQVVALQARAGQTVSATFPMMTIVPDRSRLQADFYVPSRAIGFIRTGQEVRIEYDTYPIEEFGAAKGTVLSVADAASQPGEIRAPIPIVQAGYRVRVGLTGNRFMSRGYAFQLRPDMVVRASFILEQRTLLGLMLRPFRTDISTR